MCRLEKGSFIDEYSSSNSGCASREENRSCNTVRYKEKYSLFKRCSRKSLVSVFERQLSDDAEEDSSENTKEKTK